MLWSHQKKYPKLPHKISLYFWNICAFFLSFFLHLFIYLIYLFIYVFVYLFIYSFIYLFIYLFVYLYWMYKHFDIFWYFAETCRKLFKLQTNHKWSLGFETLEPNFSQWHLTCSTNFFGIIFTNIDIFSCILL